MHIELIDTKDYIISSIKEQIKSQSNYELIDNIFVDIKKRHSCIPTEIFVTVQLCNGTCFAPKYLESKKSYWTYLTSVSDNCLNIASQITKDLYELDIYHKPLQYDLDYDYNELEIQEFEYLSDLIFKKNYSNLNKSQRSIIFSCLGRRVISSGDELIKHLEKFTFTNKHFPFRYEKLYKAYEYAIDINMFTDEHLTKIEELRNNCRREHSQECLHKLLDFCTEKKRWFYKTEKEMVNCINHIYRYYCYDWYNEQECQNIDDLFYTYANNESNGELAVNSYLVKLGYDIKKQFTFDNCKDKRKLPFDTMFYIDEKLCLIEFDGEQHFKPIDYFGGEEHLRYIQFHDNIKDEYCKKHNIPLLRIRYDEFNKIEELINQFIHSVRIMTM